MRHTVINLIGFETYITSIPSSLHIKSQVTKKYFMYRWYQKTREIKQKNQSWDKRTSKNVLDTWWQQRASYFFPHFSRSLVGYQIKCCTFHSYYQGNQTSITMVLIPTRFFLCSINSCVSKLSVQLLELKNVYYFFFRNMLQCFVFS